MIRPLSIAKRIGVSAHCLSCFNKEQTGENLMEQVARCRIAGLKKMTEIGSATIQRVSQNVGYISPLTSRRAFLKCEAVNPGDYRGRAGHGGGREAGTPAELVYRI